MKIKRKRQEHNPASSGKGAVPQVKTLIMLHNSEFSICIELQGAYIDHRLSSNCCRKLD
jgi:hypothetical protein